jgi:hypothetical protein
VYLIDAIFPYSSRRSRGEIGQIGQSHQVMRRKMPERAACNVLPRNVLPRADARVAVLINQTVNLLIAAISHRESINRGAICHFALRYALAAAPQRLGGLC